MQEKNNIQGRLHPLTHALRDVVAIFSKMGFSVADGPELESEWYNFSALNVPANHPARDMQDTFWIQNKPGHLLRTHATSTTIRELEKMAQRGETERRAINPGKVFRNEATDITHEAQFYQFDGFAVGPNVTLAHLKGTLLRFYKEYLGDDVQVRFRPSFFPFTEPSVEIDVWFTPEGKEGRWLEMMGAGMFHPTVLKNAGLDPDKVQAFAFGPGLERVIMIKHGISDVRLFHNGDIRFNFGFK